MGKFLFFIGTLCLFGSGCLMGYTQPLAPSEQERQQTAVSATPEGANAEALIAQGSGESYGTPIKSVDGKWTAYSLLYGGEGGVAQMFVKGPIFNRVVKGNYDPKPISFSPDNQLLLYADATADGWTGMFVLELRKDSQPKQITNINIFDSKNRTEQSITVVPESLTWNGHVISFTDEKEATADRLVPMQYFIDLDTGAITRATLKK